MVERHAGEVFAGLTALCWSCSALCFEYAGRRIGSLVVNLIRLAIATALLAGICLLRDGANVFDGVSLRLVSWIALSGVLGFFVCDMCLFRAFVLVGARRSMLIVALAPVFAAVLDFVLADRLLGAVQLLGMVVTLSGVAWVILERHDDIDVAPHTARDRRLGTLLALIAAMGQALGASAVQLGTDLGDGRRFDPLTTTFVRVAAGMICFMILLAVLGWGRRVIEGLKDRRAIAALSMGAVVGPVVGVTLFVASLQRVATGVTQTILATIPVIVLVAACFQKHDRITAGQVLGTLVAVAGVIVLCLG